MRSLPMPMNQGLLDADPNLSKVFARTRFLVMDEADRLLEPGFGEELRPILTALPDAASGGRQTLLFSATMTISLIRLQSASMKDAFVHQVQLRAFTVLMWPMCTSITCYAIMLLLCACFLAFHRVILCLSDL